MRCKYCRDVIRGRVLHFRGNNFCSWDCLGDYLLDQVQDEVDEEVIPILTPAEKKYQAELEAGEEKAAIRRDLEGWD
jgi:hypothetical protein